MYRGEFNVSGAYRYKQHNAKTWLLSHIMRYPLLPIVAIVGGFIATGLFSVSAMLVGNAFDIVASPDGTITEILPIALTILAVHIVQGIMSLVNSYAFETLGQRIERDARDELYVSLLGKSQTFHNRQRVGDIMARASNDVQQVNRIFSPGASLIFDSLISIIIPFIAMGFIYWQLLLTPLIFLVSFILALKHYNKQLAPITGSLRRQFGTLNARLTEAVAGIEVVKAYAQEEREKAQFSTHATRYRDLFVQEGDIKARYLPLLLYGVLFGLSFGHAIWLHLAGILTIGKVIAFMGLIGLLRFPTFISLFSFSLVQLGFAGADRILALINTETEFDENADGIAQPIEGEVVFDNVSFGYDAEHPILKHVSFVAKPGETIAIVGQTGSGKTTLTRLVNRIYDTTHGHVRIDGHDVREWSLQSLRSQISTIEQDVFLFSRTLAENIAFGLNNATREQIEQAARQAQAHDFIMTFPQGYDTMVGERGVTLSGGQRQRIAIARAFLTNPRILILDDSTSAIDSATEDQIQRAMRRIFEGRTTLLITPRLSQIRWADRILVIRQGEIVAQGTHDDLMQTSEPYRRIFARYD